MKMKMKMKIIYLIIILLITAIGGYFIMKQSSEINNSAQSTPPKPGVGLPLSSSLLDDSSDSSLIKKPTFIAKPFPSSTLSEATCIDIRIEQTTLEREKEEHILKEATLAYLSGRPKEDVADTLWFELSWIEARSWYKRAAMYEAVKARLPTIRSLRNSEDIVSSVERFNASISSDMNVDDIVSLDKQVSQLWQDVSFNEVDDAIFADSDAEIVLGILNSALSEIPEPLLRDPQLSPIGGIIVSTISLGRLDVAITLLKQYPSIASVNSKYENAFRMNILAALNSMFTHEQVNEYVDELILRLNFDHGNFMFYEITMWMFDNTAIKEAITKLESQNIRFEYQLVDQMEAPEPSFRISYDTTALNSVNEQYAQCQEKDNWLSLRQKTAEQWQGFEEDVFIAKVAESFEYKYCEKSSSSFDYDATISEAQEAITIIRKHLSVSGLSLAKLNLTDIDFPSMSDDVKAIVSVATTDYLLQTGELDEQQIVAKLSSADLAPQPSSLEIMELLITLDGIFVWLDVIDFSQDPQNALLLNQAALTANFDIFERLSAKLDLSNIKLLDPFFFFIQGYSDIQIRMGNSNKGHTRANSKFIDYFVQNDVEIKEHHLRAAFEKKIKEKRSYDVLVKHFSELAVSDELHYFGVRCNK